MQYLVEQLANGISLGCVYALIALGFAMVYGLLRFLNFAHSEVFTAGAFIAYFVANALKVWLPGSPFLILLLVMAASGVGAGLFAVAIERLAYRPLRAESPARILLSAIGVSIVLEQIGIQLFGARARGFVDIGLPVGPRTVAVVILLTSFGSLHHLVYRTNLGRQMRAVAEDAEVALLMGIDTNRIIVSVFFVGGFFAGIGGVVWGLMYGTVHPQMGFHPGLKAFIIAVIGSIGNITGTFVTGIALGVFETLASGFLPPSISGYQASLVFMALICVLVLRPAGLLGRDQAERV